MAEYIEREAAREKCCSMCEWEGTGNCDECEHPIDDIPAADVAPVRHGRWERKADPYGFFDTIPVCSVCDCTTKWREEYLYCPNCGALMDKDGDGDV